MARYLIVANRTLAGPQVIAEVLKIQAREPSEFHLVVPASHAHSGWSEGNATAHARANLERGLETLREAGVDATGEVGDESPSLAVGDVMQRAQVQPFDAIILSTLPPGVSRWLKRDLPHRLAQRYGLPVIHLVAAPESVA
ncbi:MAG: hypothetical protein ACT4OX_06380 [Actinomycetota bacterium]